MNYYEPRQRESDKRWDFTNMNDGVIWPVGYCRAYKDLEGQPLVSKSTIDEFRLTAHKHHTDGHATREEASACYKEYILDHHLSLHRVSSGSQHKCEVCGEWTQLFAELNHTSLYFLCEKHHTREEIAKLYGLPDQIISSY